MIKLKNVSKRFGETQAVDDISFNIGKGQVVGFLGPNGAGKSTTMRMMTGFLAPDAGQIKIADLDVGENAKATKSLIGYLPENNPLYEDMLVRDYLLFTIGLRGIDRVAAPIDEVVDQVGIAGVYYRPIGELSKGYRQRVGLAQAILHQPEILILDEPTEGLDPNQRVEIRKLIKDIGRQRTVVLSTHVLREVESTCGRVIIINDGSIVVDSDIDKLMSQAKGVNKIIVEIAGSRPAAQLKALKGVVSAEKLSSTPRGRHRFEITTDIKTELRPQIFKLAKEKDWTLWELYQEETSLEDVFRDLTVGDSDDK